jgi:hypothetical protein
LITLLSLVAVGVDHLPVAAVERVALELQIHLLLQQVRRTQ